MALFHICQEAFGEYSQARQCQQGTIDLWSTSDRALLEIHDNGEGFDLEKAS